MGGFGSGARRRKKRTAESCLVIDTADLQRRGWLAPGTRSEALTWPAALPRRVACEVGCEVEVAEAGGSIRLQYEATASGERLDHPVPLVTTPCQLGGRRWWFVCPLSRGDAACGRRVRKVYLAGQYLGCRYCHDLTYRSRQRSDARVYARTRLVVDAIRPTKWRKVGDLGVMMQALTILQKRYARPLRWR